MQTTLADSFNLILPNLPASLVPLDARAPLRQWAEALAPIPRCGFEISLTGSSKVDLQQCILAGYGEPQRLRQHLRSRVAGLNEQGQPAQLLWDRIDDFLASWGEPASPLHEAITELWLEFDHTPARLPLPSVFAGFPQQADEAESRGARYQAAQTALDVLWGGPPWEASQDNLRRCFEACTGRVFVAHIGVMLGRPASTVRVNVKRLSPDALAEYLEAVHWPGAIGEVCALMAHLYGFVEHITVCLDIAESLFPHIGFECILRDQPPQEPRWAPFIDELVNLGWCSCEKGDALLTWPGRIPPNTTSAEWPAPLITAALLEPTHHFGALDRRLGHIKIVHRPGQKPEAKAYFGFEHIWLKPSSDPDREVQVLRQMGSAGIRVLDLVCEPRVSEPRAASRQLDDSGLRLAMEEAVSFLLGARTPAGWWLDFPDFCWGFESWVTAIVASKLAVSRDERAVAAARHAWRLLERRQANLDGWGCGPNMPIDCDSTAWGLRLAVAVGEGDCNRARQARKALLGYLLPDGGYPCYHEADLSRPLWAAGQLFHGSYDGWCKIPHTCITASAAVLDDERPRDYLRGTQRTDGSWTAYWWEEAAYSTAFAAEALAATGLLADRVRVRAAVQWAVGRIEQDGAARCPVQNTVSAFGTALCVRILVLDEDADLIRAPLENALAWLTKTQRQDGAWLPSARMFSPLPNAHDPHQLPERCPSFLDTIGVFTTAFVVSALAAGLDHIKKQT